MAVNGSDNPNPTGPLHLPSVHGDTALQAFQDAQAALTGIQEIAIDIHSPPGLSSLERFVARVSGDTGELLTISEVPSMHSNRDGRVLTGIIAFFNLSPKGVPEGIVLSLAGGGETVQVNFDPEVSGEISKVVADGDAVTISAMIENDAHHEAIHPVFQLIGLCDSTGKPLFVAEGTPEADVLVHGKIVRLNHARRGEVNGAILETGDFVHLRPHGVHAIGGLSVGQTLEARGEVRSGWSGRRVIEARSANGIEIGKPHKARGPKHGPRHQPHMPKHAPGHKVHH